MGAWGYGPRDDDEYMDTAAKLVRPMMQEMSKILRVRKDGRGHIRSKITPTLVRRKAATWRAIADMLGCHENLFADADQEKTLTIVKDAERLLTLLFGDEIAEKWRESYTDQTALERSLAAEIRRIVRVREKLEARERQFKETV